jgi:hypothetical protein
VTPGPSPRGSEPIYLVARVGLKYGTLDRWNAVMPKVRAEFEANGWRMQLALSDLVGAVMEVIHVWEVPDANSVASTIDAVRASEALAEVGPELFPIVLYEQTELKVKTPYGP